MVPVVSKMSPIYEDQINFEDMKQIAQTHLCADCGGNLTVAWSADRACYMLWCGDNLEHNTIIRPYEPGAYDIPEFNLFQLKRRKEMAKDYGDEKATQLAKYEGVSCLTKDQAKFILQTIWPKAPDVELIKAAITCATYGLNPLMKHLYLIPFRTSKGETTWVQVLGIGATRLIASRKGGFGYVIGPRLMTEEEQREILGEVDPNTFWAITIVRDKSGMEAPGYGSWAKGEEPFGIDKGNTKQNMAFIRSERNALDRLFPGEMPQGIGVIDEDYAPVAIEFAGQQPPKPTVPAQKENKGASPLCTEAQRRKIFASAKQMGYEESEIKAIIRHKWGVESTKELTIAQASELIGMIEKGETIEQKEPFEPGELFKMEE